MRPKCFACQFFYIKLSSPFLAGVTVALPALWSCVRISIKAQIFKFYLISQVNPAYKVYQEMVWEVKATTTKKTSSAELFTKIWL